MLQNWRNMPRHSFGFQVQCGECESWVTEVAARDAVDARAGKGRCRDCVAKAPAVVEVQAPPAPEGPTSPPEPAAEEEAGVVEVDTESPIPGVFETAETEPVAETEEREETPRKRR